MASNNGIIIQVQSEGSIKKRRLYNNQGLLDWLNEFEAGCLLDPDDVQETMIEGLNANLVYRLGHRKRSKPEESASSEELIKSKQFKDAWCLFEQGCASYIGLGEDDEFTRICNPVKVPSTWKGHALVRDLRDTCDEIKDNIKNDQKDDRSCRVIGVRLGSGCGKSHLLLEAPNILEQHSIYITYNLRQFLGPEQERGKSAILLRILLRLAKIPNANCPNFFTSEVGSRLLSLDSEILLPFVLHRLKIVGGTIFIGVDEVMELKNIFCIESVLSMLGEVATKCYQQNDHQECYIFVSSLNIAPFHTSSGRPVRTWTPESPDESAVEHVLNYYAHGRDLIRLKALALSAAGFHFRSLVFAAEAMGSGAIPSVEYVLCKVCTRWKEKIQDDAIFGIMKKYVVDLCMGTIPEINQGVEQYLDGNKALPPALIFQSFGAVENVDNRPTVDREHPLFRLFNCELAFTSPAKHLEQFGLQYDFFRQHAGLPVFSELVRVIVPMSSNGKRSTNKQSDAWFKGLQYPSKLTKSGESLFSLHKQKPVLTGEGESPNKEKYYAPDASNYPLIDRAFTAFNGRDECLVLIQDKVNNDVPKAVEDLNSAANLIKAKDPKMEVLCIVNVIGASRRSTSQGKLEHPYILVRDDELDDFYSVNFASVARFARVRHRLQKEDLLLPSS